MKKTFLLLSLLLLGAGCIQQSPEIISYDLSDVPAEVEISDLNVNSLFTAQDLYSHAEECGTVKTLEYYQSLQNNLESLRAYQWVFTYTEPSQIPTFKLNVVRNAPGYESLAEFREDFDICAVGGQSYPYDLSNNWLIFTSSCGSGYDNGSGDPSGCQEIRQQIDKTLEILF